MKGQHRGGEWTSRHKEQHLQSLGHRTGVQGGHEIKVILRARPCWFSEHLLDRVLPSARPTQQRVPSSPQASGTRVISPFYREGKGLGPDHTAGGQQAAGRW